METRLRTVAYAAGMEKIFALELLSAAMGIRVPLSQALFSVAEVSKQSVKYKGQVKDCQIP